MNLIFMGPPGSGKGTQNKMFEDNHGLTPISTGDMFRAAITEKTEIGLKAKAVIDKGDFMPDDLTVGIVRERLSKKDYGKGFILDGFPRTIAQAVAFDELLPEMNLTLDRVVLIDVSKEEIVRRLTGRRTCRACKSIYNIATDGDIKDCKSCGGELYQRDDDTEAVIRNRLDTYDKQTLPLKSYYDGKNLLVVVNGENDTEDIYKEIESKLGL